MDVWTVFTELVIEATHAQHCRYACMPQRMFADVELRGYFCAWQQQWAGVMVTLYLCDSHVILSKKILSAQQECY